MQGQRPDGPTSVTLPKTETAGESGPTLTTGLRPPSDCTPEGALW
jgi:hypothetical protein